MTNSHYVYIIWWHFEGQKVMLETFGALNRAANYKRIMTDTLQGTGSSISIETKHLK